MSLDVWLSIEPPTAESIVKKHMKWIETLEERHSDSLDFHQIHVGILKDMLNEAIAAPSKAEILWEYNITHNLNRMATEAEIYEALWRPSEINVQTARDLIDPLTKGLFVLRADPDRFKALNPANGWGSYDNLVKFVVEYLKACIEHPDASVNVCR